MEQLIGYWLEKLGTHPDYLNLVRDVLLFFVIIALALAVNLLVKKVIVITLTRLAKKSKTLWDDIIIERKVLQRLSHLAPALVIYYLMSGAFREYETFAFLSRMIAKVYMLLVIVLVLDGFLSALNDIYNTFEVSKIRPIKGYVQIVKIIVYVLGAIFLISILIGKSPLYLLGGLGALTAVIMFVFKDVILGFVGSIQLTANDMVRPGDWVSMPQAGADGTVIEMNLTTVKVQNWDKTITTVPTYNLISDSFQNWRGMEESGGRRIKRSLYIDVTSIRFCDAEMMEELKSFSLIKGYIEAKEEAIRKFNQQQGVDESRPVNGRRQTNIGIFRAYLEAYLSHHDAIRNDMTLMVRQLKPEEKGLPIEVYVFSKVQEWVKYEAIQSDIFDHIFAVIPHFGLKTFQNPSSADFKSILPDSAV